MISLILSIGFPLGGSKGADREAETKVVDRVK